VCAQVTAPLAQRGAMDASRAPVLEAELVCGFGVGGWDGTSMLGEGPMWSVTEQALYWVDCSGKAVHRFEPATGTHACWALAEHIGCLVCAEDGGFAAAVPRGFVRLQLPEGGGQAQATLMCSVEQDTGEAYDPSVGFDPLATVRGMNDGKCDRQGRFWAGSVLTPKGMAILPAGSPGSLWWLGPRATAKLALEGCGCAQGPAWTPDNTIMYWTDSQRGAIEAFDYDLATGSLANRRTFCSDFGALPTDENGLPAGGPDGLTVDAEGYIWSAVCLTPRHAAALC
jgi:L-arabinonolactonase